MNRYRYIDEGRQHLHTLDGKPLIGTSSASKIVGGGAALINWAANMAVDYIIENFKIEYPLPDYNQLFQEARTAHIKKRDASATKGTERHGLLEEYVREAITTGYPFQPDYDIRPEFLSIEPFIDWAIDNVERFLFTEANCYSEKHWLGGIADIGILLKDGRRVVGDHKSGKSAYHDQFIQAVLYDIQLSENGGLTADGDKLFDWEPADGVVIFPFRSQPFTPEFRWNMDEYREAAIGAVKNYTLQNK